MSFFAPNRETVNRRFKKMMNLLGTESPQSEDLTTTLFLGDLSITCDEGNLFDLFSRFGAIESIQLKKSERDPQRAHLGFGFIKFTSRESAERALQEMNGYFFLGRAMRVGWALSNGERHHLKEKAPDPQKGQTAQIHVMFVTRELNRRVSELDLGGVFSRYGNLVDIAIKKNVINHGHGVQSGYAFLHFSSTPEGLKSALTAVEEVNNLVVDNIAYQCKLTHNLQTHLLSMKHSHELSLIDLNFKTYESHPELTSVDSIGRYHENAFQSYTISPSSNGYTNRSYESLSPSRQVLLHGNPFNSEESAFSRTNQMITDHRSTMHKFVSQSSTTNNNINSNNNPGIHPHYPDHYYEQPANPLNSSSVSSNHIYEREMKNPYEDYEGRYHTTILEKETG